MKQTLEGVLKKVKNPPAPQNWVRLISPNDIPHTAKNIANFAFSIPAFNYSVGSKMCHDRVKLGLVLPTALRACAQFGAPAGREQNANFVKAFYKHDEGRRYSDGRYFDSYEGFFPISRDVKIPTKATFTIIEDRRQVPVVLCGWKSIPLDTTQRRIVATLYESGLFSYGQYRHSPSEIVFFPEFETELGPERLVEVWQRFDYASLSNAEIRDLLELYALAQEEAIPIIHDKWSDKQRRERQREQEQEPQRERPSGQILLFEK